MFCNIPNSWTVIVLISSVFWEDNSLFSAVNSCADDESSRVLSWSERSFNYFKLNKLKLDFITILFNLKVNIKPVERETVNKYKKIDPKYIGKKMRRNEPCFCGSGKKFKHCCGSLR